MTTAVKFPRLLIAAAAVLWSFSGVFVRALREPVGLGLESPELPPLVVATYRNLFAGLILLLAVRRADIAFRLPTAGVVACFAAMSGLYVTTLGQGNAANAILLKYTAPFWVALATVCIAREKLDRRNLVAVVAGVSGAVVIVLGNWPAGSRAGDAESASTLLMALGSGVAYAGVVMFLGSLRGQSTAWLNAVGLIGSAAVLAALSACRLGLPDAVSSLLAPTARQFAFLALFAAVQMAVPYWLFTRGLRQVRPQEAGVLTLIEPVLTPAWVFLLMPSHETPTGWTLAGGAVMLAALAARYLPARDRADHSG